MNETGRDWPTIIAGVGIGLIIVAMLFVTANYLGILSLSSLPGLGWLPTKPEKEATQKVDTTNLPDETSFAFSKLPFKMDNPLVDSTNVTYIVKGKVNRVVGTEQSDEGTISTLEVVSINGQETKNFNIPQARIVNQDTPQAGDDIQLVVSVNLDKPEELNIGSVYLLHDLQQ